MPCTAHFKITEGEYPHFITLKGPTSFDNASEERETMIRKEQVQKARRAAVAAQREAEEEEEGKRKEEPKSARREEATGGREQIYIYAIPPAIKNI